MYACLTSNFDYACSVRNKPVRSDRVLNYVWINKELSTPEGHLCSVPLNYIDKAYHNARLYPDTEVKIWVDQALLDPLSSYLIKSHSYINAPSNVSLHNLREIPTYSEHPAFATDAKTSMWNKVDLARFVVLAHCLRNEGYETAFYADFDLEDVELDSTETQERLANMGMAYGQLEEGELLIHGLYNTIAHGYIVMDASRADYLEQIMLPTLSEAVSKGLRAATYICLCVCDDLIAKTGRHYNYSKDQIFTTVPVHPCNRNMPAEPLYEELGLCPSFSR